MSATLQAAAGMLASAGPTMPQLVFRELPDPYAYPEGAWSPYLVGALIGLIALASRVLARKSIGASSAYADAAGLLGRAVAPRYTGSLPYYQEHAPRVSWTLVFVVGIVAGSLAAAVTGNELTGTYLQDLWIARFGEGSAGLRTVTVLIGGLVMAFGARLAGGCTSGHGIDGTLQMSVGSWIAVICFFVGGIATAMLIYRM